MDGDVVGKGLLSFLAFLVYAYFAGKKKKNAGERPVPSAPKLPPRKQIQEMKLSSHPVKHVSLTPEMNPLMIPEKRKTSRGRTLLRGKSKREAIILSEILRNPYLP